MAAHTDHRDLIFQWEVRSWSRALPLWRRYLRSLPEGSKALALGERDGGLSLLLAEQDCEVICSDLRGPTQLAKDLHIAQGIQERITYASIDTLVIPKPDNSFDIVAFKFVSNIIPACKIY